MKRQVPEMKTDQEAEAFLDEDLSDLDFAKFQPLHFSFKDRPSEEDVRIGLEETELRAYWLWPLELISWISTVVLILLVGAEAVPVLHRVLPFGGSHLVAIEIVLCLALVTHGVASSIRLRQISRELERIRKAATGQSSAHERN
ncbi:MAG TPA: CopG family antitoxin [Stellaceae bacterium]|nr:CopG family antitoxin [Stellaceae bacterium]